ncbi:BaiN/RdsA family NAD(P)/FAD-dependent oxidoreductase [Aristophania vespae]|uniref:NAD(P)/FAD-dependent oxidoreductase n=1 Tax=Aristophania vespae TaxID=2697033 RepID=UPI002351A0E4|nr:aminoacetone oxidase family FAD-binding enzyme [Aristophania vespae]UMM63653.1 hypothetical protein DM15PD_06270 [Aristophania vespae]
MMTIKNNSKNWDVIILGAGAAGLMAAAQAGQKGARVVVIDHAEQAGRKILISGGGRCNFTNLNAQENCYLSQNTRFMRSSFARFTPSDFLKLVQQHKIAWEEKEKGQLFCQNSARDILDMLLNECHKGNVEFLLGHKIGDVSRDEQCFIVQTSRGVVKGRALILATGGLAIPKLGATDFSLQLARRFGLKIIQPAPALVPFILEEAYPDLAGVSLDISVSLGTKKPQFTGGMVFTHKGLSGPAILQISSYWQKQQALVLNLMPGLKVMDEFEAIRARRPQAHPPALLERLPQRLGRVLAKNHCDDRPLNSQPMKAIRALAGSIERWVLTPFSSEGYGKAEVMRGGIDTKFLSSKTMESVCVPGLYAIGEAVDMTGWLGGYNFQWAWSSGYVAGQAAAQFAQGNST